MVEVKVLIEGSVKAVKRGVTKVVGTTTLVRDGAVNLIVDPGMLRNASDLLSSLRREGLTPGRVNCVFVSHHHIDHTRNIALFPNAKVVDFWAIYDRDRWIDHDGDGYRISKNVKMLQTPGHTEEDASLAIRTDKGTYVTTHLWWHEDFTPKKDPLAWNQRLLEENRKRVLKIADFIIPGHGKIISLRG